MCDGRPSGAIRATSGRRVWSENYARGHSSTLLSPAHTLDTANPIFLHPGLGILPSGTSSSSSIFPTRPATSRRSKRCGLDDLQRLLWRQPQVSPSASSRPANCRRALRPLRPKHRCALYRLDVTSQYKRTPRASWLHAITTLEEFVADVRSGSRLGCAASTSIAITYFCHLPPVGRRDGF